MGICPICNGFEVLMANCCNCHTALEDKGRIIDYFDDYSPYMEIDHMKLIDGIEETQKEHLCAHLTVCPSCNQEQIHFVQE